jgi:hypothetical protein
MKSFHRWLSEDFGKVLFAPNRKDVAQPPEKNTPEEDAAWEAFQKHYIGGKDADLVRNLPKILAAMKRGEHKEFLEVPKKYKFAYRLMADLPISVMRNTFGITIDAKSGKRGVVRGGTYTNERNIVSSWTVDTAVMPALLKDFGSLYRRNKDSFHVLMVCDISRQRDSFIINPDKYHDVPQMAGQFSYQKEIISHKPIKVLKTVFCDKDEFGGSDSQILDWLISQAK